MLIAFLAPRVQLAKLCESGLAQQFAASPALLLCDIGLLLRSTAHQRRQKLQRQACKNVVSVSKTLESSGTRRRLLNRLLAEATHQK